MACTPIPVKVTVPDPGVKVPPLLVRLAVVPPMFRSAPATNVPAVSVTVPVVVKVGGALKVP